MERERVELVYELTAGDLRESFAAQVRHTVAGRLARLVPWAIAGFSALGCVLRAAGGELEAGDVVVTVALVALALFLPRWQLASACRRAARRGERRAVVDGGGLSVTDSRGGNALPWTKLTRFMETERLFVLLGRGGNCFVALPKRAAADQGALRALLERHTSAGGAAPSAAHAE
ncbi:YcxB family protein [Kitasatospora sp. NPDC056783]|uniref:YcxB family protein n=1 Tax=Kitasatospora sp. NPDC056783 TaxID=3345943 RepID=UPI003680A335